MTHQERTYRSADGLTLFFRDFKAAEDAEKCPVLCLPGLTRNSRDFIELAERLSAGRRVLCPDLRGRGFSERDPKYLNYTPPTYVQDALRLLEHEKIESIIIIGTSLGGLMALIIAASRPEILKGVILNDVGPEIAPEGLARVLQYVGKQTPTKTWEDAVAQARETYGQSLPGLSNEEWLAMAKRGYREDKESRVSLDLDPKIGDAAREAGAALVDPWELYAALKPIPTLALRGAISDILNQDIFDRMAAAKPDLIRVTVPDRGHVPLLNEAEAVAAIEVFLEKLG